MSDLDPAYDLEVDDVALIRQGRRATMSTALADLGEDPQKAARAYQLGRSTGDKPALIYSDLDNYEAQTKASLTASLLRDNDSLREWIDQEPMRAKLAADDWGQLDAFTGTMAKFREYSGFPTKVAGSAFDKAMKGVKEGFGEGPIGGWVMDVPVIKGNRAAQAIWATAGTPIEAFFRILGAGERGATEAVFSIVKDVSGSESLARDIAGMAEMQMSGTGVHGATHALQATQKYVDALSRAKLWIDSGQEPPRGLHPEIDRIKEKQNDFDVKRLEEATTAAEASVTRERDQASFADLVRLRDKGSIEIDGEAIARLYGDKPPAAEDGLLGWVPGIAEQLELSRSTGADISIPIADWMAYADGDLMRLFRDDIRVRPGGITKNETAAARGEDVNALRDQAAADLAAKSSESLEGAEGVATAKDQNRAALGRGRESGAEPEVDEVAKEYLAAKKKTEIIPDDLPAARAAGGLEPLFSLGDRKLTVERRKLTQTDLERQRRTFGEDTIPADEFRLLDENGNKVGWIEIVSFNGGKRLYVDNIGGMESKGFGPNSFGNSLTRDILRQLKKEYPEAEEIGGFRISGAREKAGTEREVWIKFDENIPLGWDMIEPMREILQGTWEKRGQVEVFRGEKTLDQAVLSEAVDRAVRKIAPRMLGEVISTPLDIRRSEDRTAGGLYQRFHNDLPTILVSLEGTRDVMGIARHEAIHHLRKYGFFDQAEWGTLERAARQNRWQEKFLQGRYEGLEQSARIEESIAEAYRHWAAGREVPDGVKPIFQKLKDFIEEIRLAVKELFGREMTAEEIFKQIESGKIGGREGTQALEEGGTRPFEPAFSENEKTPPFRTPGTIGITAQHAAAYNKALREKHEADIKYETAKAQKESKRRLTAEWRTEKKNVEAEVDADFDARPDVAADLYLARGELFGQKVEKLKIDPEDLKAAGIERSALPKDYVAKGDQGTVDLDDLASLVGYPTGKDLLADLAKYNQAKLAGNMGAKAFRNRLAEIEVERRMTQRFGDLDENIRDSVLDHVSGRTEQNLIAEEIYALGLDISAKTGKEVLPFKRDELREALVEKFDDMLAKDQSAEKYLRAMGKLGTQAELGVLRGKIEEAYRAKQTQYAATVMMREARGLEKDQKSFAKLAKRLGKREAKGLDPRAHDWIQTLLWQAGIPSRRSLLEIQHRQSINDPGTFPEYIQSLQNDLWSPDVSPEILAGRIKPVDQMTVSEFREFKDAIESLNYIGRQVDKINIEGEKREFAAWKAPVIANIQSRPMRSREAQESIARSFLFRGDAELTKIENWFKELDLGEEMGPLVNAVIRPVADSKHKEYSMQEKLAQDIKALPQDKAWKKSLKEVLPNDWLMDPSTGQPFKLTRSNMISLMLNMGNKSNLNRLANYGSGAKGRVSTIPERDAWIGQLRDYVNANATEADWKFVQGIWDIYKGWQRDMEIVALNTSGKQPKLLEPLAIDTPFGRFDGGYYPLIRDTHLSGLPPPLPTGPGGVHYPNYTTPQNHLKLRAGAAAYYVDFRQDHGMIPIRMQQVIHDIAFRDTIMAGKKVISDKEIMNAIRQHYGKEYEKQLGPWLERVAHGASLDETALGWRDWVLRSARMNLTNYALPFNYVVTLTPDIGAPTPSSLKKQVGMWVDYWQNEPGNRALAEKWSKEIPHAIYNMDRDFREAMERAVGKGKITQGKAAVVRWGYGIVSSVSKDFRRATWVSEFYKALEKGHDEAKSAAIADSYVRERHGSAHIADLPPIMAGGEAGRLLTMFYGYWNTQYNWVRTIKGDIQREEYMKALQTAYGTIIIGSIIGATIANQAKEEDSAAKRLAKAVPLQLLGMMPYGVREFGTYLAEGIPPNTPLGSLIKSVGATKNDVVKLFRGEPVDKGIRHTAATVGMVLGIPGTLQAGRTGQGIHDAITGRQKPRDFMEWVRLIGTGEARLKRQGER
jgi:hypothetical protein